MKQRWVVLMAACAALMLASTAPAVAENRESIVGGRIIAVQQLDSGETRIVSVRPADGHVQVLTSGHQDLSPDVSPDGRRITFTRCVHVVNCDEAGTSNVWLMRADGSNAHRLTNFDGTRCQGNVHPAFTPDGRQILFTQDRLDAQGEVVPRLLLMRIDGTHVRQIAPNGDVWAPAGGGLFSPDGRWVAFRADGLMIMRPDGSGVRPLLPGRDVVGVSWSPDSRKIAILLERENDDSTIELATIHPDGSHLREILTEPSGIRRFYVDYAPDGQHLVFTQVLDGCRLTVITKTGTDPKILTPAGDCYTSSSWGPKPQGHSH
jgi:Tol biopolymer transport system component